MHSAAQVPSSFPRHNTKPLTPPAVAISAPALVANAWFPASERGLATGVAVAFNTFGLVFSFFVGPLLVQAADFEMLMTYM
jgi:nitrate/nitrite transporter NarK